MTCKQIMTILGGDSNPGGSELKNHGTKQNIFWWQSSKVTQYMNHIIWVTMNNNKKWLFYDYFWPYFCQLYNHLSQNWGSDGHFDVLNRSKIWLVQRLWHKMQIFPFSFFCNFVQKHSFAFCVISIVPIKIKAP